MKTRFMRRSVSISVRLLTTAALVFAVDSIARAALIVNVQDASISPGQTGTVDVLVHSDGTDTVASFNYEFHIADVGSPVGSLRFVTPQTTTETGDANYIFSGDSGGVTSVPQNGPAFDQITGGDLTASFSNVTLTSADRLQVRLDVEHVLPGGTPASAAVGDQFTITLQNTVNTFFKDASFNDVSIDFASSTGGTVTAVPEPGTFMTGMLIAGMACLLRRRRKTAA